MYKFKIEKRKEITNKYKLSYIADQVGITAQYLSNIVNGKKDCKKVVAYCITKMVDNTKEIEYFFTNK